MKMKTSPRIDVWVIKDWMVDEKPTPYASKAHARRTGDNDDLYVEEFYIPSRGRPASELPQHIQDKIDILNVLDRNTYIPGVGVRGNLGMLVEADDA